MYRQTYPDAPHLYSRRGFRKSLREEFSRSVGLYIFGLILAFGSLTGLFYNEGRAVQTYRSLDEAHQKVIIPETTDVVFEENNGKLVLVADKLRIEDALGDPMYGLSIQAVKLKKVVQMYQWYQTEDRRDVTHGLHEGDHDGGHVEIVYSYAMDWFDHLIDSEAFENPMGHHNPEIWPFNSSINVNSRAKLGNFILGKDLKDKFTEFTVFTSDERPRNPEIKMHAGLYFHAEDVWKAQVGDIRVQFSYAGRDGDQVTVIGKQSGREIRPYQTDSGDSILLLHPGLRKAHEIFHFEHTQNRFQTWLLRAICWFGTFIGFNLLSGLLDVLVQEPSVRSAMEMSYASLPFSFALTTSMVVTGISWLFYKPMMGVLLLFLASIPYTFAFYRMYRGHRYIKSHRLS